MECEIQDRITIDGIAFDRRLEPARWTYELPEDSPFKGATCEVWTAKDLSNRDKEIGEVRLGGYSMYIKSFEFEYEAVCLVQGVCREFRSLDVAIKHLRYAKEQLRGVTGYKALETMCYIDRGPYKADKGGYTFTTKSQPFSALGLSRVSSQIEWFVQQVSPGKWALHPLTEMMGVTSAATRAAAAEAACRRHAAFLNRRLKSDVHKFAVKGIVG